MWDQHAIGVGLTCYRSGIREDFKHACFLCPKALSLYTSIYQTLGLTPNITITSMLLGHQRPCYIGDQKMRGEELDIIDLVSTMTLGHIATSMRRSSRSAFRRLTGNDVSGHYKRHYFFLIFIFIFFLFFLLRRLLFS